MNTANRERVRNNITLHRCHVIKVSEDEEGPGFGYSIGLYERFEHSEIIFVGLRLDLIHSLINNMAEEIEKGRIFVPNTFQSGIIGGYDCFITNVSKEFYDPYVGQSVDYYGNEGFPLIQCIYPTVKGIYPWQQEWPQEIRSLQPILGNKP